MINTGKIKEENLNELITLIQKNTEKTDLAKYFLFTNDPIEKASIFLSCYRVISSTHNLINYQDVRDIFKEVIEELKSKYVKLYHLMYQFKNSVAIGKENVLEEILKELDNEVDEFIDDFSKFTERINVLQASKIKGFSLEGKSGEEFKKIIGESEE